MNPTKPTTKRKETTLAKYRQLMSSILEYYPRDYKIAYGTDNNEPPLAAKRLTLDRFIRQEKGDPRIGTYLLKRGYMTRIPGTLTYKIVDDEAMWELQNEPEILYNVIRGLPVDSEVQPVDRPTVQPKLSWFKRLLIKLGWK